MEDRITICGETYIKEKKADELQHVIIRARDAGVFAGYLLKKDGDEVQLKDARRLWFWSGAASLSQLAMEGTSKPNGCKFPTAVDEITVIGVIEIIPTTVKAKQSINDVKVWEA